MPTAKLSQSWDWTMYPQNHLLKADSFEFTYFQFCNTNMQERLNGTLNDHCHMARGLNSDNSLTYPDYIRPHTGLDGKTPAEAANIQIQGTNKWIALIQQAAMVQ